MLFVSLAAGRSCSQGHQQHTVELLTFTCLKPVTSSYRPGGPAGSAAFRPPFTAGINPQLPVIEASFPGEGSAGFSSFPPLCVCSSPPLFCCPQALQQWSQLQQHWCQQTPLSPLQALQAAEDAAWLLQRLVTQEVEQQLLSGSDVQELRHQSEVGAAHCRALWTGVKLLPASPPANLDRTQGLTHGLLLPCCPTEHATRFNMCAVAL